MKRFAFWGILIAFGLTNLAASFGLGKRLGSSDGCSSLYMATRVVTSGYRINSIEGVSYDAWRPPTRHSPTVLGPAFAATPGIL